MTQPYTDYKYTKKVGAEANETFVFRFGTHPPVYQAASLCKNYKGCRALHARIMLHPKFSNGRYTGTGRFYQDKKAQKRWDRL